jgi:carbon-monoxide dehydrogenase iron sulfur subunit
MNKILVVDHEKCTGCRNCEMACSVFHMHASNPAKSAVRIVKSEGPGLSVPVVCQQCEEPPCAAICPVEAISRDPETEAVVVDGDLCVGCQMCVVACPFGAVVLDRDRRQAIKCDLCGGADPWCVRFCDPGALTFKPPAAISLRKKRVAGRRLLEVLGTRRNG